MEEIGYIEGAPFFANNSGNPIELDSVLKRLHRLVTEYGYSIESPVFVYYLDRIAEDMVISEQTSIGPTPTFDLPIKLEADPGNPTEFSDEDYRFYIFYILCRLHEELDDHEGMRNLVDRYEAQFQDQPYFGKVKALSLLKLENTGDLSVALDQAFNYSRRFPDYPDLHKTLAEVIAVIVEREVQYAGSDPVIPDDDQTLLELGIREIKEALEVDRYPAEYLVVKARIESLRGDYDLAKSTISKAISGLSRSRTRYTNLRAEFGRIENRIETRRQQSKLEDRTAEISRSVTDIESKLVSSRNQIDEFKEELDSIQQSFQRTFLEFLGFFSAIIAVIVITGQIALEFSNPEEAGRLLLLSYGGLLFAFGGFAAILSSDRSEQVVRILLSAVGLFTAVVALYGDRLLDWVDINLFLQVTRIIL